MGIGAFLSGLAIALPLIDAAIKDKNYEKVKEYQNLINSLAAKYNVTQNQLNSALAKYQSKYSEAANSLANSTRGSIQYDKSREEYLNAKDKIKQINSELADKSSKYERASDLVNRERSHYENKGIVQTIRELTGRN